MEVLPCVCVRSLPTFGRSPSSHNVGSVKDPGRRSWQAPEGGGALQQWLKSNCRAERLGARDCLSAWESSAGRAQQTQILMLSERLKPHRMLRGGSVDLIRAGRPNRPSRARKTSLRLLNGVKVISQQPNGTSPRPVQWLGTIPRNQNMCFPPGSRRALPCLPSVTSLDALYHRWKGIANSDGAMTH